MATHRYWLHWDDMFKYLPHLAASYAWVVISGGIVTPTWEENEVTRQKTEKALLGLGYISNKRQCSWT
jgi:hypothetical protein